MLFGEEIRQATARIKWHGEPLTADTIYALALTGASWEVAWGKEHLFSLARADSQKSRPRRGKPRPDRALETRIAESYRQRDYQTVVRLASANFSLDEIASDPTLKQAVGASFLELGQPERAFAIFAAPYQQSSNQLLNPASNPPGESGDTNTAAPAGLSDEDRQFREGAFNAARQAGLQKEAVAFALSLLLEPGTDTPGIHGDAQRYLEQVGVDIERVLLGILEAPERLRGLAAYTYAAADLLTLRASPRLLPTFVQMSESDDVYLHARALLGLGVIAYRARPGERADGVARILPIPLTEYGISAGQRKLIVQKVQEASRSGEYRLRAAAALALGLLGQEDALPTLQKLARDRAYLMMPVPGIGRDRPGRLRFPVREAAAAALARYGITVETGDGEFSGRNLEQARRGGQDVTNDRGHLRRDVVSALHISPTDVPLSLEEPRR
jgi:HEAT repeat protein